ncbi:transporter substrate-binding domain-containing protein [Thalassotalea sp. 1_MG-2023]|uniref:substrate-binding periplasmic protein n=1 Tax=Thalassotalea sp. 1_MG-2023 TaxID=3062680 RepID=UPI0026E1CADE|nr:transporter substrate-binding domain-containing protein [Thalassotalea sp. 1_MG-2023]MDO6428289.1 transporter substrate-binding domain-containing protein [Thalassotalea sp. 1_MG-2023]
MGYRTNNKLPLIEKAPNNNGVYQLLFSKALAKINCKLTVIRAPKKRILYMLQKGEIDFYPGLGFNNERAEFTHYFENGLHYRAATISRSDVDDLTSFSDMRGKTILISQGANYDKKELEGVYIRYVYDLSIGKAIELISLEQADFYAYNEDVMLYYLSKYPTKEIKVHQCCSKDHPMYLGFSLHSKHIDITPNPTFNEQEVLSVTNQKQQLTPSSIAYQFQQALKTLDMNGDTAKIWQQYSTVNMHEGTVLNSTKDN